MRGGTKHIKQRMVWAEGLSPHARGNQDFDFHHRTHFGPIPACAGEPVEAKRQMGLLRAYPRMRGGTTLWRFDG